MYRLIVNRFKTKFRISLQTLYHELTTTALRVLQNIVYITFFPIIINLSPVV